MPDEHDRRPGVAPPGASPTSQLSYHASRQASPGAEKLVTVESQREFDLFTGARIERTFVKLYVEARRSGLLAAISDRDWKTLCTLATYMDGEGYCFPSQAELAKAMGCSRQMANERIRSLAAFRFQGQAVLIVVKGTRSAQGTWARNGYQVRPIANLRIYDHDDPALTASPPLPDPQSTVSRNLDTATVTHGTVSSGTGTVGLDTKKNQTLEQEEHSNIRRISPVNADETTSTWAANGASAARPAGPVTQTDHMTVRRRLRPRRVIQQDEDYQMLQSYLADFAREFNDRAPLKASTMRAYNLFKRAGISQDVMIDQLYAARAIVKERTGSIRKAAGADKYGVPTKNKAAYFFAVLEDLLGLRVPSAAPTRQPEE